MKGLIALESERIKWSLKTFPEATAKGSLNKAVSEIDEIRDNLMRGIKDPYEYADAIMCLLDSAARDGMGVKEILQAYQLKMHINKSRKWTKNSDGSYSHVKPKSE